MTQAVTEGEELSTDETTDEQEHEETELAEAGEGAEGEGGEEGDEGGVTVTIGEESPPSDEDESRAPEWVRELRKNNRETQRRNRELEQELTVLRGKSTAAQAVVVGDEPTLEGCEYDEAKFKADWKAWNLRLQEHGEQERKKQDAQTKAQAAWQAKLDAYGKATAELKVKDFADAEDVAKDTFSVTQQGVILSGADNPAVVIYALGKNPKKAKELASIEDPVKFAFAVAKLETQMKVTPRKTAPLPESTVRGSAPGMGAMDSNLKRLEAEAEKTGDRSKVVAYKKQLKQKAAA
ncbi:hypothetical protein [Variovorax paradoxus]|uniref:hypothetical protein n=1 Tax=Variovorax paradoxus TaxID=34073 RepID=UPI0019334A8A|nr:hypothetical protein INQ48_18080 [Variovorax paradoxus]